MKFATSLALIATLAASVQAGNPDCKLAEAEGYGNCKNEYYVSGSGADALWCVSESDCLKVFPEPTSLPTLMPTETPQQITAVQELDSSSSMARVSTAALLVAAIAALW